MMVLSTATCVHLGVADDAVYAAAPFYDGSERARRVLRGMAAPCTAVIVTTAVGFGSLSISSITPVRMFGLLMAARLVISLVFALFAKETVSRGEERGAPREAAAEP